MVGWVLVFSRIESSGLMRQYGRSSIIIKWDCIPAFLPFKVWFAMKSCNFDSKRLCRFSNCDIFDCSSGNVGVCSLFSGGDKFTPHKVVGSHLSLFQIFALKRKGVDVVV
jgi:hypothetical protein